MLEIVKDSWVEGRGEVNALEIAITTPMKGLFQASDKLWKDLSRDLASRKIAEGDAFRCRREAFLTDRRLQPLKKKWTIELSIKLEG